jgi:hypothetical protein
MNNGKNLWKSKGYDSNDWQNVMSSIENDELLRLFKVRLMEAATTVRVTIKPDGEIVFETPLSEKPKIHNDGEQEINNEEQ